MTPPAGDDHDRALLDALCSNAIGLVRSVDGSLRRLRVQACRMAVELEWSQALSAPPGAAGVATAAVTGARVADALAAPDGGPSEGSDVGGVQAGLYVVRAPIIGSFYASPQPGAPPFVSVGDLVTAGQQIGLLEAMKLMNPIETDRTGRVVEILVTDGTTVEYDQPLLTLAPADAP